MSGKLLRLEVCLSKSSELNHPSTQRNCEEKDKEIFSNNNYFLTNYDDTVSQYRQLRRDDELGQIFGSKLRTNGLKVPFENRKDCVDKRYVIASSELDQILLDYNLLNKN